MDRPGQDSPKHPVAVLGATGTVGQRFLQLLEGHPRFQVEYLCASERSAGHAYGEVARWMLPTPIPEALRDAAVHTCKPMPGIPLVFSALDASVAGPIEEAWARSGALVVSNAKSHRMDRDVPLVVAEVNPDHLELLDAQAYDPSGHGGIVANPNCSTIGLALALAPIERAFGIRETHVVTMQALSGAGLPGVASFELFDNVIPHIGGEEEKLESETQKILGRVAQDHIEPKPLAVSATCNRVPVLDGHTECVSLRLERKATAEQLIDCWNNFRAAPQEMGLPTAPERPTIYHTYANAPQPRLHRDLDRGMATSIGRLRPCALLDWKFTALSHNTLRGAAGGALLVAELLEAQGRI